MFSFSPRQIVIPKLFKFGRFWVKEPGHQKTIHPKNVPPPSQHASLQELTDLGVRFSLSSLRFVLRNSSLVFIARVQSRRHPGNS